MLYSTSPRNKRRSLLLTLFATITGTTHLVKVKTEMTNAAGLTIYQIEIVETMSSIVEVVAIDDSSAILQARDMYRNEDIELSYDDLIDTKFNILDKK